MRREKSQTTIKPLTKYFVFGEYFCILMVENQSSGLGTVPTAKVGLATIGTGVDYSCVELK